MVFILLLFLFNFGGCHYFETCNTGVDSLPEIPVEKQRILEGVEFGFEI
jgi:hypothetical protein